MNQKQKTINQKQPGQPQNFFIIAFSFCFVTCPGCMLKTIYTGFLLTFILLMSYGDAAAQYKVKGTVFDSSRKYRIEAVTVMSTAGRITMTDSLGRYQIDVAEKDSVWFSFLGKPTPKYPVLKMADVNQFDIALQLKAHIMEEVKIKNRSYKMDSIQNRKDYAKVFDYQKVSLGSMTSVGAMGAGFDIQELIRMFQFRKNRSMLRFQERLIQEEQDKFVTHRFNKGLVKRLTLFEGEELDRFMQLYRPTFEFSSTAGDYDFQMYIKIAADRFRLKKGF